MSDINVAPALADTATMTNGNGNGHHAEPAVGQPAIPDGTPAGATPATVTDTQAHTTPATGSVTVKDNKSRHNGKPAKRDRGNLTIIDPNIKLGGGYSDAERKELEMLYGGALAPLKESEIIKGRVVAIADGDITVDIGFKSEGVIAKSEFSLTPDVAVGDEVEVFLESIEDKEGRLVLSRKQAEFTRTWQRIIEAQKSGEILQAKCSRRIKGGMVVDVLGIEAFLPGSQIDVKPVRDFDAFLGKTLDVRVVKINFPNENVVVSHKVLLEEHLHDQRKEIVEKLERGQVLEGTVKAIADFGAFVDLGGIDGLVHITDLTWGRVQHPSEVVKLDQVVTVVVLDYDENKRRISLGMKQLMPHPWARSEEHTS